MKTKRRWLGLLICGWLVFVWMCTLNGFRPTHALIPSLTDLLEPELVFSTSSPIIALASGDNSLYVATEDGDILQLSPENEANTLYTGLSSCGFSNTQLTVLPDGRVIVNDCVDDQDTLLAIDQAGIATTLHSFDETLIAMTSDQAGQIYLGFWLTEGDISMNFQPFSYLAGADDMKGQIVMMAPDSTLTTIYEGGLPLSLNTSQEGDLFATIWGQAGSFRPAEKSYSICDLRTAFWIALSDQVHIIRIADQQVFPVSTNLLAAADLSGTAELLFAVGRTAETDCGVHRIMGDQAPAKLSFTEEGIDQQLTSTLVFNQDLYLATVDGNLYRVALDTLDTSEGLASNMIHVTATPITSAMLATPVIVSEATEPPTPAAENNNNPSDSGMAIGDRVEVVGVGAGGLNIRTGPGFSGGLLFLAYEGERFALLDGPQSADELEWWKVSDPDNPARTGWTVSNYLSLIEPSVTTPLVEPSVTTPLDVALSGPVEFYLDPADGDQVSWVLTATSIEPMLAPDQADGMGPYEVALNPELVRAYVNDLVTGLTTEPVNARFIFNDDTREIELLQPSSPGYGLDMETVIAQFETALLATDPAQRRVQLVLTDLPPEVPDTASAQELGITERIVDKSTYFVGSTEARQANIQVTAARFHGLVIPPGDTFSFNQWAGEIPVMSEDDRVTIMVGDQAITDASGGVSQVATTAFRAAFWGGFSIVEHVEHAYRVSYYEEGELLGMDAAVYAPLVDLRFVNDTRYHLLIETEYDAANSTLNWKFYSTSMNRRVVKEGPVVKNVQPPPPPIYRANSALSPGQIRQVDYAISGSDVYVWRTVYQDDQVIIDREEFHSHYVPLPDQYEVAPGDARIND